MGDPRIAELLDPQTLFDLSIYTAHVPAVFERLRTLTSDREAAHV